MVADLDTLVLLVLVVEVLSYFHYVHAFVITIDDVLRVKAESHTAVVGLHYVAEDTILILIAHTHRELAAVSATGNIQRVAGGDSVLVAHLLKPVGTSVASVLIRSEQIGVADIL